MRLRYAGSMLAAMLLCSTITPAVHAGQVRMNVGVGGNFFGLRGINCNVGDHVIWVWTAGSHTCTSGDSATSIGDGKWDSGTLIGASPNNGGSFNWKSTGVGTFPFFCSPHAPGMAGHVFVAASGISVADLRISEVLYNAPTGTHLIEIKNFGLAAGDLGRFRLSIAGGVAVSIPQDAVPVAAGGTLTIHANASGANTATDLFLPTLADLPASGALSLYVPNTKPGATALTDSKQIIDFVQWGAGGGANEATAVAAGFWNTSDFVPGVAPGHSIEYCDEPLRHGLIHWFDNPVPNPSGAADNCLTPVQATSWGRIKKLYR